MPSGRPHLLKLAIALMSTVPVAGGPQGRENGMSQQDIGRALKWQLDNAYRNAGRGKPTRAAHYKRLAKRRRNMRARSKK